MKTQIIVTANRTIYENGKAVPFTKGEVVSDRKARALKNHHFTDGFAVRVTKAPNDSSTMRRRDGRRQYHDFSGTDYSRDIEFVILDCLVDFFGNDELRALKREQITIFNRTLKAVHTNFGDFITVDRVGGMDDAFADPGDNTSRAIHWVETAETAASVKAFVNEHLSEFYSFA